MRAASALRSDSFFLTQASQDLPDAVSSPVKAIATISAYGIFISPGCPLGKNCRNGGDATPVWLKKYPTNFPPQIHSNVSSPLEYKGSSTAYRRAVLYS